MHICLQYDAGQNTENNYKRGISGVKKQTNSPF